MHAFVRRARGWGWLRECLAAAAWAAAALLSLALAAAVAAGSTHRGDVVATAFVPVAAVCVVVILLRGAIMANRARPLGAVARLISRTRRRLSAVGGVDGDPRLREAIAGAFDLLEERGRLGSATLRSTYIDDVEAEIRRRRVRPHRALPALRWPRAAMTAAGLATATALLGWFAPLSQGAALLFDARDGRPQPPPEPVWSELTLELRYPAYTRRPDRTVANPSGALRLPAGTTATLRLVPRMAAEGGAVIVAFDGNELADPPAPERVPLVVDGQQFMAELTVRGAGSWTVVLHAADGERRSAALPIHLETDRPPEIEVTPPGRVEQSVRDNSVVDVRWTAKDDFGIASVELVYQLPDGTTHRQGQQRPRDDARSWRASTTWDISTIPLTERAEVLYWLEVRDGDPGLGLEPLPDPPGKVTRSAVMRLEVEDEQAEHTQNAVDLRELRDLAVDGLAERMVTAAFADPGSTTVPIPARLAAARALLAANEVLLTRMAASVDALSVDALAEARDAEQLAAIHRRLLVVHRREAKVHAALPSDGEHDDPSTGSALLDRLAPVHREVVSQLEDEIIRLDDLVDGMLVEQMEALVARLEATQRKLVELLEQLKAGDETARPQIEQLEQRRRDDLRRLAEIRALLREEVEQEFMNLDAFAVLERMANEEQLQAMLQRGEVDRALEQAQGELDQVQMLRNQVQERAGGGQPASPLSEEERRRIALLRELSQLQDEVAGVRTQTSQVHDAWRKQVAQQDAKASEAKAARTKAEAIAAELERINDARLGRDARRGLDDARAALQRLRDAAGSAEPKALELAEAADAAEQAIARALAGSERGEGEGKALERARERAAELGERLDAALPRPETVLPTADRERLEDLRARQDGIGERTDELSRSDLSDQLPPTGRRALERAENGMSRAARALQKVAPRDAGGGQNQAWQGLQEAIDSLRRGSPPPPTGASGDGSTAAERDRSLRDELMDAMREDAPPQFVDPVRRYYEELLR